MRARRETQQVEWKKRLGLNVGQRESAGELTVLYERKEGNWVTDQKRKGRPHTHTFQ